MDPQILDLIRETILTVLTLALPFLLMRLGAWLDLKASDDRIGGARRMLVEMARDAVATVEQTYVKPAKTPGMPGAWDDAAKLEAMQKAQGLVLGWIGVDGAKRLSKRLGVDHDALVGVVDSLIEAEVARRHQAVRIGIEEAAE